MAGDIMHYQMAHTPKIGNANILVDTEALSNVLAVRSANHQIYVQKITLSITTHFATAAVVFDDDSTAGPPVAAHTDVAAGAGVPSVVHWDFGPVGRPLGVGGNLDITVTNPGIIGIVHIEAYERLVGPVAVATTN